MISVRAGFELQAEACESLGSPLTARLCRLAAQHLDRRGAVGAAILDWRGDSSSQGDAVALRLMGGLHGLVLSGRSGALAAAYAAPANFDDAALWAVVAAALQHHEAALLHALGSAPQTNEVRRSVPLAAIGHWLSARFGLPLVLWELGASAGLNLCWPEWRIETPAGDFGPAEAPVVLRPEWRGQAPSLAAPEIAAAAGVDLAPLDPATDRLRLLSYIWADQADRLARTEAALDHAAAHGPRVERGDAVDWLAARLAEPQVGRCHLVFHTIAWQYFPQAARAEGEARLATAGRRAPVTAPLARFGMEADDSGLPGAALTLDLWPEGRRLSFGRADFHGRWIDWQPPTDLDTGIPL